MRIPKVAIGLARRPSQIESACVPGTPNTALAPRPSSGADKHVGAAALGGRADAHEPSSSSAAAGRACLARERPPADPELLGGEGSSRSRMRSGEVHE